MSLSGIGELERGKQKEKININLYYFKKRMYFYPLTFAKRK